MTSRISGFYKKSPKERLDIISKHLNLSNEEERLLLGEVGYSVNQANQMVENVIGVLPVPLGVAVNFKVNEKEVFIPMATEEASVIAAASHAAKFCFDGFFTSYSGSMMRAQIQAIEVTDPYGALSRIYENKALILEQCNEQDPTLVSLGGGAKDLDVHVIEGATEKMVVTHLIVDTKDAMGANAVNSMAEAVAPLIEDITGGKVVLRILSNLADQRIVRARGVFENPFSGDKEAMNKFIRAYELAQADPYRAATHNKGIMNGISAVVLATGNDTRAVEAGAHAYASITGRYKSLTHWEVNEDNSITGTIALPMPVGLVGGATQSNPVAKLATKILDVETAEELAGIVASTGLAQNFAGLKALAGEGIQKGHMKLHARNMAMMAGAEDDEMDNVVELANRRGEFSYDKIKQIVLSLQKDKGRT
ncbi:hydroxymethylglutaryl-CoA reductase, degradative [Oceanobacillus locisalsi]|uniref:3-hydroxy-3-methylglutaryl coenzyme A reductase n=1 Tax=Oceanobacillus locisalsi TaxID=546107 RepID=A0ABW3NH35_9BACI